MDIKRFIINKLILFFMLSTLITVAVALIGSAFAGEKSIGYKTMLMPIGYAALCMLPTFVTYSKRELSLKEMLLRKALMLVLLEGVMMLIVFTSPVIDSSDIRAVLTIAASVLVIFVLVNLFLWLKDSAEAKKMNRDLKKFLQQHEE
ncbi:MAG: DUF3021 family protein [Clostridia bacterium]|nr:DUF3021 family protein [Clostridia bacterium]